MVSKHSNAQVMFNNVYTNIELQLKYYKYSVNTL